MAVASSIFQGVSQSFGEAVFLGFLKGFPSEMLGDVSTGTGFAGILATFTLVGARAAKLSNQALLLIEAPTAFAYFYCFKWLDVQTRKYRHVPDAENWDEAEAWGATGGDQPRVIEGANVAEESPGAGAAQWGGGPSPKEGQRPPSEVRPGL